MGGKNDKSLIITEGKQTHIHLYSIESSSIHFGESVFPILMWNPRIMDAPRYISEWFSIFEKSIIVIINCKWLICWGASYLKRERERKKNIDQIKGRWFSYCSVVRKQRRMAISPATHATYPVYFFKIWYILQLKVIPKGLFINYDLGGVGKLDARMRHIFRFPPTRMARK